MGMDTSNPIPRSGIMCGGAITHDTRDYTRDLHRVKLLVLRAESGDQTGSNGNFQLVGQSQDVTLLGSTNRIVHQIDFDAPFRVEAGDFMGFYSGNVGGTALQNIRTGNGPTRSGPGRVHAGWQAGRNINFFWAHGVTCE